MTNRPVVTSVRYYTSAPRRQPKAGDRRTTKRHGLQIRVQGMATDWTGRPIGRLVNGGRPVFWWVAPRDLDKWDRHLLTMDERAELFPEPITMGEHRRNETDHGCGHMQGRGAA